MTPADRIADLNAYLASSEMLHRETFERLCRTEDELVSRGNRIAQLEGALSDLRQKYESLVLEYSACEDKRGEAIKRAEEAEALAHKRLVRLHALAEDARQLSIVASFRSSEAAYTQMVTESAAALDAAGKGGGGVR